MSTLITDKVDNAAVQKEKLDTSAYLPHTPWLQFLLVCCLFALWGMAGNLNDILIAQFKKGFDLTDTQTALVQSIFFLGYFFVALPAAALIKRFSYKAAIIIGLCLYALGCFLFVPAAQIMTYGAFLACLGVIACGLSFLETSANTYSSLLGPIQSSTQRINFSQIFNSLGVISGVLRSFTIRFVQLVQQGTSEHSATYWLLASLVIYAVGKTVATWLMNRLNPAMLLGTFALAATALLLIAVFSGSMLAVYALILVSFCMAPCWPTNFGLVIKGMGKDTQTAGSIVVMSIIGGAVIPLVMGIISDMNGGNMQIAFIAPLLCFVYVAFYGFWCVRKGV